MDLVILDVMMPRMNGYQACRLLKTEPTTKTVPVVILTSKDQAGDRFWGLETGADYYITKDSEPQRILELVKNILATDGGPPAAPPPRPGHQRRHPVARERPPRPQALRGDHPLRDRPGGAQPRAVRRDLHLRHGARGAASSTSRWGPWRSSRRRRGRRAAPAPPGPPAVVDEAKARLAGGDRGRARRGALRPRAGPPLRAAASGPAGRRRRRWTASPPSPSTTNDRLAGMLVLTGRAVASMTAGDARLPGPGREPGAHRHGEQPALRARAQPRHPRQPHRPVQPSPHHGSRPATSSSAWAATRTPSASS